MVDSVTALVAAGRKAECIDSSRRHSRTRSNLLTSGAYRLARMTRMTEWVLHRRTRALMGEEHCA